MLISFYFSANDDDKTTKKRPPSPSPSKEIILQTISVELSIDEEIKTTNPNESLVVRKSLSSFIEIIQK